jgi:hypothetical protein
MSVKLYDRLPLNQGLVLDLPLYESQLGSGDQVLDLSRYHNNGVVTGATWGAQGRTFVPNNYIKNNGADFRSTDSVGAIGVWFKTSTIGVQSFFSSADEGSSTRFFAFGITGDQYVYVQQSAADVADLVRGSSLYADGVWHHAVLSSNGTAWAITVDNIPQTLVIDAGANTGDWFADTPNRDNFAIGALIRSATGSYYNGLIGEVQIYNRVLSAAEIGALFNQRRGFYGI